MATKIFVGKLSSDTVEKVLMEAFSGYGEVISATIIMDRDTNRSRGFGFVEMADLKSAQNAIKGLDGQDMDGRAIVVNAARPQEDKPRHNSSYSRSR